MHFIAHKTCVFFVVNLLCVDVFSHYLITGVMEFIPYIKEEPFGKSCAAQVALRKWVPILKRKPQWFPTALYQTHKYKIFSWQSLYKLVRTSVSGGCFPFIYLFCRVYSGYTTEIFEETTLGLRLLILSELSMITTPCFADWFMEQI